MARLNFSTVLAAGATADVLSAWQYQYVPRAGKVNICLRSTTATSVFTFTAGSETLAERQPIPAGGTAGVTPTPFNSPVIEELVAGGDRLKLFLQDTGAGCTVDGFIDYQPLM